MKVSCIIVGQGIAGTSLAWQLRRRNICFRIIDPGSNHSASAVSSGLINPITGRNYVKSWMVEDLIVSAIDLYKDIGNAAGRNYVHQFPIVRTLHDIQEENSWHANRLRKGYDAYMTEVYEGPDYQNYLNLDGCSMQAVLQGMSIDVAGLLSDTREIFKAEGSLIQDRVEYHEIVIDKKITWRDIQADVIIFAEGYRGINNPYFKTDSYRPAKGEVLILEMDEFPREAIIKFKKFFVPMSNGTYWVGSNYLKELDQGFTEELSDYLEQHLKVPYNIVDRKAGIRPATKYRRPFISAHELLPQVFLVNGLGTKGISLAPYWTDHLLSHIYDEQPLSSELRLR